MSPVGMSLPLLIFYGNVSEFGISSNLLTRFSSVNWSLGYCNVLSIVGVTIYDMLQSVI